MEHNQDPSCLFALGYEAFLWNYDATSSIKTYAEYAIQI